MGASEQSGANMSEASYRHMCHWFLLCDREADTTRHHPVLGNVPICARCDAKVAGFDVSTQVERDSDGAR